MADARFRRKRFLVESTDEAIVEVPFGFTINGTSNPDTLVGDSIVSATLDETGEVSITLREKPAVCFFAKADVSVVADDVDIYARCDWSDTVANGIVKIRFMTGATQTNPTDNTLVGGIVYTKKTTRAARRA